MPEPTDQIPTRGWDSLRDRLFGAAARPKGDGSGPKLTDAEVKEKVTKIDDRERKIGYAAAAIGAALAFFYVIPFISNPKKKVSQTSGLTKGHCLAPYHKQLVSKHTYDCVQYITHTRAGWIGELIVLLLFPLAIWVTALIGRRAALGFAALMSGFAFETLLGAGVLGLPYLFFGGWLLVRAWRSQRYGTVNAKEAAEISSARRAEKKAGGTPAKSGKAISAKSEDKPAKKVDPSKRYTPKAPPKKKPPRYSSSS